MRRIIHHSHHKLIFTALGGALVLSGFAALSLVIRAYSLAVFWSTARYLFLLVLVWIGFAYHTHRRHTAKRERHEWPEFANYLILPSVVYWSAVALLYLDPFNVVLHGFWIAVATAAVAANIWYLMTVFHAHRQSSAGLRQAIFLAKILASYLGLAAALGMGSYLGYGGAWTGLLIFLVVLLLMRQALFQHHDMGHDTLKFVLATALAIGVGGYLVYYFWNVNFYSGALVLAAMYNAVWGYVHHKYIDRNLTREIVYEYLAVLFVTLVIVFSTTNFGERLIK